MILFAFHALENATLELHCCDPEMSANDKKTPVSLMAGLIKAIRNNKILQPIKTVCGTAA